MCVGGGGGGLEGMGVGPCSCGAHSRGFWDHIGGRRFLIPFPGNEEAPLFRSLVAMIGCLRANQRERVGTEPYPRSFRPNPFPLERTV